MISVRFGRAAAWRFYETAQSLLHAAQFTQRRDCTTEINQQGRVVEMSRQGVGVLLAEHSFTNSHGALEQRFGFLIAALEFIKTNQVVDTGQGVGVFFAQHLFTDSQGALEQWFGLLVAALGPVEIT